ncbi:hypothetical protein GCM10010124_02560 [Pilimelia terevasa]|uniref:NAD-dependent epimerase/dehydratase domain-containing protein n=1 Tax=Pilimelia terevasa TaxID=53372 RepID=A0A8J3BGL2_9ACTN|nr:NAD-dependent epimerase/dehydratase family protein [Pilimelia terevasa]GGK13489.1 hypothetical protein GCM10010124_02560 [Pilimelia terevasa]
MRILILGGGWFLGRTLASDALARGWEVTLFNRGRSGMPVPGAARVTGDRTRQDDLKALAGYGPWDATIDTSAYEPADVSRVLTALGSAAGRYALVSTVSAYRDWPEKPVNEQSAVWPSRADIRETDDDIKDMPERFQYGVLKAGCELAARRAEAGSLIVRPGVILGPGEYVGRMSTLLARAKRGGRWLVPGPPQQPIQPVDVRDVSAFILDRVEADDGATYNLTAPEGFATYRDLVNACLSATGGTADLVWVDPRWLTEQGVGQWTEIPLWRTAAGTWCVDGGQAAVAGFHCRPLAVTVLDAWSAAQEQPPVPHPRQAEHGLNAAHEQELLRRWDAAVLSGRG